MTESMTQDESVGEGPAALVNASEQPMLTLPQSRLVRLCAGTCGEVKRIFARDMCQQCYQREVYDRKKAGLPPLPREYVCERCGETRAAHTTRGAMPRICPDCAGGASPGLDRSRQCAGCGKFRVIKADGLCAKCDKARRRDRAREERGPISREYICADCDRVFHVDHKGALPKRCPECLKKFNAARAAEDRKKRKEADPEVGLKQRERDRLRRAATKARHLEFGLPSGEKVCPKCGRLLAFEDFPVSWTKPDGRHSYCRGCLGKYDKGWKQERRNDATRRWQEANPLAARLTRYAIDVDGYIDLLSAQGGKCVFCNGPPGDPYGALHVDHDPVTGKVRGLLCVAHNSGLGKFGEDPEKLRQAAQYIEWHRANP